MNSFMKWAICSLLAGVISGLTSFLFLVTLNGITHLRVELWWPIFFLPVAGLFILWLYDRFEGSQESGPNELLKNYRRTGEVPKLRSGVVLYATTLLSHLVGASVGREGTAVVLASASTSPVAHRLFKLNDQDRKGLILMGMAGGFGGFFGVPFAGALFALELVRRPKLPLIYAHWILLTALLADKVVVFLGGQHLSVPTIVYSHLTLQEHASLLLLAGICGLVGYLYLRCHSGLGHLQTLFPLKFGLRQRMLIFSAALLLFFALTETETFAGLGVPIIEQSFYQVQPGYFWAVKLILTAACLSFGFKGGEVTPLFFVGATLGSALSVIFNIPLELAAAIGLIGVFAAVLKIPWAAAMMAVELFGLGLMPWAFMAPMIAYLCSGKRTLYRHMNPVNS